MTANGSFRAAYAGCALCLAALLLAGCPAAHSSDPQMGLTDAPAAAQAQALAALRAAGLTPVGPLAWVGPAPVWQAPGDYRIFFAAAGPEGGTDIYAADLRFGDDGAPIGRAVIRRMTDTPEGHEDAPTVGGGWLAYATRVADRYQSVTGLALTDGAQPLLFVFAQPPERVELGWRDGDGGRRLAVTARSPAGDVTVQIDLASAGVEPADGGLIYVPAVRGEQAWLPNLVSRVRELPFVGPEKIAFLENIFFTAVDQVEQAAYRIGGRQSEPADATLAVPPSPILAPTDAAQPDAGAAARPTDHPTAEPVGPAAPAATEIAIRPSDAPASPTAAPSPSPASASPTVAPAPAPVGVRLADGIRHLGKARPDSQRPYAEAEIIELDPRLLQIKMIPGTIEPQPTTGLIGSGVIPRADWGDLVAAFNGGFAAMHGKFGMMVERKVYLPARDGIATLAVYEDGSLRMGTWGADLKQTPDMVSYRQNCPPLIENGTITAETGKLTLWGLSVANEVYLYRSGLGLTADGRLIYVAGKPLTAYTLARALQQAGAIYAMQLDVDEFHVAFITYTVKPGTAGGPPVVTGQKLREDMRGFDGLFLRPFQLDFFYLTRRPQPLARAVRTAGAPATPGAPQPAETGGASALPGRLAFASNRAGNWEIYVMPAGQPTATRRLTEHPADDLHPAWAPDGSRLAFTSRRAGDAEIYTLRLADAALSRVTRQPSEEWAAAWSPDGSRLAYQSDRHGQSDIFVARPDGADETRLTRPGGSNEAPHWSPDGRQIVFDSDFDVAEAVHASINVYLMNADGSNARRFYPHAESPAWSPDGKTIAMNVLRGGRWQIVTLNLDGSGYRQLTTGAYDARYPAWSPDGRWLAFAANETGRWDIYVVSAAGGPPFALTRGVGDNTHPAWGP